ncbi:MAG: hypothetical protein QM696_14375 [Steroidobacteraceae bacterium]
MRAARGLIAFPAFLLWGGLLMAALVLAWLWAHGKYRQRMAEAEAVWAKIAARTAPAATVFTPELVAGLPEIAQRYFLHAIAPGTPLSTLVEIRMQGRFRLGGQDKFREFTLHARQILAPPDAFVWLPVMRSGPLVVTGSDGLIDGKAWTRFWLLGSIPLVQTAGTEDLRRAALARPVLEAIWVPASLLPQNGARWEQAGPDEARIVCNADGVPVELQMALAPDGRVLSVSTLRWSDANPGQVFRFQPFGGRLQEEAVFGGFTIPSVVEVGNQFGTPGYFPFFLATITAASYR